MAADGANIVEDADMAEYDGEKVVTMMDVLQEQQDFEDDANAVLGASDEKNCTYSKGYIKRQAIYACLTCCLEVKDDPTKRAGVCLACSLNCHENHELIELYTKRNFRCDCGNPKFNSHPCQFTPDKSDLNNDNKYNQNFSGLYCNCHRPYPDLESVVEDDEMIQCIICEDWLHASHLDAVVPGNDQYSEMICKACMERNEFLHDYSNLAVNVEMGDVDVIAVNVTDTKLSNGDLEVEMLVNGTGDLSKDTTEKPENDMDVDDAQTPEPRELEKPIVENNANESDVPIQDKKTENPSQISSDVNSDSKDDTDLAVTSEDGTKDDTDIAVTSEDSTKDDTDIAVTSEDSTKDDTDIAKHSEDNTKDDTDIAINSEGNTKGDTDIAITSEESAKGDTDIAVISEDSTKDDTDIAINSEDITTGDTDMTVISEDITKATEDTLEGEESEDTGSIKPQEPEETSHENAEKPEAIQETKETEEKEQDIPEPEVENSEENTDCNTENSKATEGQTTEISSEKVTEVSSENGNEDEPATLDSKDSDENNVIQTTAENDNSSDSKESDEKNAVKTTENDVDTETNDINMNDAKDAEKDNSVVAKDEDSTNKTEIIETDKIAAEIVSEQENNDGISKAESNEIPEDLNNDESSEKKIEVSNETVNGTEIIENKRKLSTEDAPENNLAKKPKLSEESKCTRPKNVKRVHKGATFWPSHFRQKLCTCNECLAMYKDLSVLFLLDSEDTVFAYETLGKEMVDGRATQYEKGLEALSSLDRIQQINALTEYNKMKDKLLDFLKSFKDRKEIVKEEDIKSFFAGMKPKREPDGVYFCR